MARCSPGSHSVSSPKNPVIFRAGSQRSVGPVIEPHPAVASEKHDVLHGFSWDDVCHTTRDSVGWSSWKHCTLKRTVVEVWKGGNLPNSPSGPQWGMTVANGRSSTRVFHVSQRVGVDERLR